MEPQAECGFDESTAARYLAGRLTDDEAEAFEAHYFGCDRCWAEVRTARELRAALAPGAAVGAPSRRPWVPLAAAAALLAALGTWMLVRPTGGERVFRAGGGDELEVTLSPREGDVGVSWSPAPGARAYRVRVVTADGALVTEQERAAPPVTLGKEHLPATALFVTVQALGPDREVLASSAPLKLPPQAPTP